MKKMGYCDIDKNMVGRERMRENERKDPKEI